MLRAAAKDKRLEVHVRAKQLIDAILAQASTSKSTGLELVLIPAGAFDMGAPPTERGRQAEEALHPARITQPFFLGKFEVIQAEYEKVVKARPSWFHDAADKTRGMDTSRFPVERVTWFDAIAFCNALSERDGYPPYYKVTDAKNVDGSIRTATVAILGGNGYRLPTETEWEYACRAHTTTAYSFGPGLTERQANANFVRSISYATTTVALGRTAKVGSYPPNAWGLHEMHGNVAEWCWDWRQPDGYAKAPLEDSHGPAEGLHRVLRGGSWLINIDNCRSASRFWQAPGEASYFVGFRVARTP